MNYNEAKEKALKLNGRVNTCREYEKAYHFIDKDYNGDGDNGVVILKETGNAINWITFILNHRPEKNPKEIEF